MTEQTHKTRTPDGELPLRLPAANVPMLDREAFHRRFPADAFLAQAAERRRPRWMGALAVGTGGAAAVAAAILLVVVLPYPRTGPRVEPPQRRGHRVEVPFGAAGARHDKGRVPEHVAPADASSLRVQAHDAGALGTIQDGAVLHAETILRFHYDSATHDYLYLFSVDAHGAVSSYYPEENGWSVPIVRGRNIPLPGGVMLDDYVGRERFFALFSTRPLSRLEVTVAVRARLLQLRAAGRGLAELDWLPLECHQETLLIEKR